MNYSIQHIISIVNGKTLNERLTEATIVHLLLDSRQLVFPKTTLFFALEGKRHDGHNYISSLYEKGVRNFIISKELAFTDHPDANFLLVKNPLEALQQLASYHRHQFSLPCIGITGSNGKTIIKEWLFQLLQEDYNIVRSPKSYNSQIGVPLSVWQLSEEHDLAIFEAGISTTNEMQKLASIIDCSIGIFSNIGQAHSEGFASVEEKINEKIRLFTNSSTIVFCKDDKQVNTAIETLQNKTILSWSKKNKATLQILSIEKKEARSYIKALYQNKTIEIELHYTDSAYIENAIHCWLMLLHLGIQNKVIKKRMQYLTPVKMRLELKGGINNCTIINDSYNADLTSLNIALNFLDQQGKDLKRTIILSDILQSGLTKEDLYKQIAQLLNKKNIHRFIGIGQAIHAIKAPLSSTIQSTFFDSSATFLEQFRQEKFEDEIILLKGARQFEFERIAARLVKKAHKTVLEINLNALLHNLNVYSKKLNANTKMMAMVKASAYGSGSIEVARLLEFHQVDYLTVAYADEGVELREAGIQLPILVLNPEVASFDTLLRYRLEAEIYSLSLLRRFVQQLAHAKETVFIHLKLDTGMNRLGFTEKDIPYLISLLKIHPIIQVKSIFSHLAASEAQDHDDFSNQQVEKYLSLYQKISTAIGYTPLKHILNSSGIIRFPQYQLDMVRLGIGLYGIDSGHQIQHLLQNVYTLKASISQIKEVKIGDTIGYSRSGQVKKPMTIATISIGYADGLMRKAGNGRYSLLLKGKKAPIIGNVCMDMCMINISHIPEAMEGDEVIIFGKELPVQGLADCLDTIPYEIFTGISERVKRVYYQD